MLQIKTTGVEDFIDGSANIKALVIGGPGAGKTRMSSYWPKPIFLDCENGRGSLADRNMPYAEIKSSKDMLDALEYLKTLERTPKGSRQFQTVVVDTADSFQRIVKDEWVQQTKAAAFSGFDAWGYLDTKMQLLFTRLLNLDYNVIVLVHYKDKTYKDGDNTVRELTLQLQGAIADQVFNDFGLVGWLGTYWAPSTEGKVQKRGLTFQPTTDKPFLKDRFHVTPAWMEINFSDNDYQQIFEAFFNRPELDDLAESSIVGEIPDHERAQMASRPVNPPAEGGALPPRPPAPAPEIPLEKKLKGELEEIAKGLDIQVRGNMLKSELVTAIQQKQAEARTVGTDVAKEPPAKSGGPDGFDAPNAQTNVAEAIKPEPPLPPLETPADPTSQDSFSEFSKSPGAPANVDAQAASPESSSPTATSSAPAAAEAQGMPVEDVTAALGATVIATEPADAPSTPQEATPPPAAQQPKPPAPQGPSACADCGGDLSAEWADPTKKNYIRLSFMKHRRYLCSNCNPTINN